MADPRRGSARNQTVAVAGSQFKPLEQDASVLRKAERSNTLPTSFRRGDIALKEEDQTALKERQEVLKGRTRRGSIIFSQADEAVRWCFRRIGRRGVSLSCWGGGFAFGFCEEVEHRTRKQPQSQIKSSISSHPHPPPNPPQKKQIPQKLKKGNG